MILKDIQVKSSKISVGDRLKDTYSIGNHSLHNFCTSQISAGFRKRSCTSCWTLSDSTGGAVMAILHFL